MEDYAACLVGRYPTRASTAVMGPVDTRESEELLLSLMDSYDVCLSSGGLRFKPELIRGAIFRALYNRTFKSKAPLDFTDVVTGYRA